MRLDTFYDRRQLVSATLATVARNMAEACCRDVRALRSPHRARRGDRRLVIPLSPCRPSLGLRAMGLPANLISLGAVDFGIIVDAAVIVPEASLHALHRPRARRRPRRRHRARRGDPSRPVTFAVLIILAALCAAHLPPRTRRGTHLRADGLHLRLRPRRRAGERHGLRPAMEAAVLPDPCRCRGRLAAFPAACVRRGPRRSRGGRAPGRRGGVALLAAAGLYAKGIGSEFSRAQRGRALHHGDAPAHHLARRDPAAGGADAGGSSASPRWSTCSPTWAAPEAAPQIEGPNNAEFPRSLRPEATWRGVTRQTIEARGAVASGDPGVQYNSSRSPSPTGCFHLRASSGRWW